MEDRLRSVDDAAAAFRFTCGDLIASVTMFENLYLALGQQHAALCRAIAAVSVMRQDKQVISVNGSRSL